MDALARIKDHTLPNAITASADAFIPVLEARRSIIASTLKKTFRYGSTDRHMLDVYYPSSPSSPSTPILFFVYGGRFTTGARDLFPGVVYDNVGAFFAQRGILTIIPDYRLAPQTTYPGPVQDLHEAVRFALDSKQVDFVGHHGDKSQIFIMGHSAGGAHVVTLLLNESIMPPGHRGLFKGAILNAGAYGIDPILASYYGQPESEIEDKIPLGLLRSKTPDQLKQLMPRLLFLLAENEPPFLVDWDKSFKEMLRGSGGVSDFEEYTIQRHNHVSANYALSCGEGDEWGNEVVRWIRADCAVRLQGTKNSQSTGAEDACK